MLGLMEPKKSIASIIIGSAGKSEDEKEVDLKKEAQLDAAKQFLKAIEKKDAQMVVDSFMSLKECCEDEDEKEESKED
jgi:hypothetical protein